MMTNQREKDIREISEIIDQMPDEAIASMKLVFAALAKGYDLAKAEKQPA